MQAPMHTPMEAHLAHTIQAAGGWIGFERFMHEALYAPGLGYYAASLPKLGLSRQDGSDFVTAPELSPFFGTCLAAQIAQLLQATQTDTVVEFGAGTGKLAEQIISSLQNAHPGLLRHYVIVDVSGHLRGVQQTRLAAFGDVLQWAAELPDVLNGVLLGNEVLDAMPVKLLQRQNGAWNERGVSLDENLFLGMGDGAQANLGQPFPRHSRESGNLPYTIKNQTQLSSFDAVKHDHTQQNSAKSYMDSRFRGNDGGRRQPHQPLFVWQDRPSNWQPPCVVEGQHDYLTEIHPQAEAFISSLAERLQRGAMLFIDYGFGEREYYHPQRYMGTLMCHQGHLADPDPLAAVGQKDITAHINFTGIALAAQHAGLDVLGYSTQGRFLINCGLLDLLQSASLPQRVQAQKLIYEHEMGELFKVIAIGKPCEVDLLGFADGDRMHTL
jgi:SAM-dependent MidA family methyltransferase